jgi:hypothetical protein
VLQQTSDRFIVDQLRAKFRALVAFIADRR